MGAAETRTRSALLCGAVAVAAAACASGRYQPCPVELDRAVGAADFEVARRLFAARFGALAVADAAAFRLQTRWFDVEVPLGQRRASLYRDARGLAVVVEFRALVEPVVGMPYWTEARGDAAAERDLAALLTAELRASPPP